MTEQDYVRSTALRIGRTLDTRGKAAKAFAKWAKTNKEWLGLGEVGDGFDALLNSFRSDAVEREPSRALSLVETLVVRLGLDGDDAALLRVAVARVEIQHLHALSDALSSNGVGEIAFVGRAIGWGDHEVRRRIRRSQPAELGLLWVRTYNGGSAPTLELDDNLERYLLRAGDDPKQMLDVLIGERQTAALGREDFAHVAVFDHLAALLAGANREGARGINILVHGPPGTGKTELARTLADIAGLTLHSVGEQDDYKEEPSRHDRVVALGLAQRLLVAGGGTAILFDEMEDLIGDTKPTVQGFMTARPGSKVYVNRLLEPNRIPVIWTTNTIENVDGAILRRMTHVLRLGPPSPDAAKRMVRRIERDERTGPLPSLERLGTSEEGAGAILRAAARAARLTNGDAGAEIAARSLLAALHGEGWVNRADTPFDSDLIEAEPSVATLFDRLAGAPEEDMRILLSGPSGTGKSALARHLARRLDRPIVRLAPLDVLSPDAGETVRALAKRLGAARAMGALLFIDDADAIFADRASIANGYDAMIVAGLLGQIDDFALPVVAATRDPARLDRAVHRRFVHRLELGRLGSQLSARAFATFFGRDAPPALADLGPLAIGDFALVARRLRQSPTSDDASILDQLRDEASDRQPSRQRTGF